MRTPGRGRSGGEDGAGTDPSPAQAPPGLPLPLEKPSPGPAPPGAPQTLLHTCLDDVVSQSDDEGVGPICLKLLPKLIQDLVELGQVSRPDSCSGERSGSDAAQGAHRKGATAPGVRQALGGDQPLPWVRRK